MRKEEVETAIHPPNANIRIHTSYTLIEHAHTACLADGAVKRSRGLA